VWKYSLSCIGTQGSAAPSSNQLIFRILAWILARTVGHCCLWFEPTKSRAGRRVVGLPDPLIVLLKVHRANQDAERETARQLWHDEGWVFAKPDGKPLNPNTDYHEWKALIEEAGLPDRRLHDARHTAATVLAILNVPTTHAMAIMGWSSAEMAARYQHVLDSIRKGVADKVGGLLWEAPDAEPGADDQDEDFPTENI
jgi:integrase